MEKQQTHLDIISNSTKDGCGRKSGIFTVFSRFDLLTGIYI